MKKSKTIKGVTLNPSNILSVLKQFPKPEIQGLLMNKKDFRIVAHHSGWSKEEINSFIKRYFTPKKDKKIK